MTEADAIVIGAGPNGLVAANLLADAGWRVVVLERAPVPGGAVRTAEVAAEGFRSDLYSAFYPLAAAGGAPMTRLGLERHGLRWTHAPQVVAHPIAGKRAAILSRDLATTLRSLEAHSADDAHGWWQLVTRWRTLAPSLVPVLFGRAPPVRDVASFVARQRVHGLAEQTRFALLSARRMAEEVGCGEAGTLLLGGNALHGDVLLEAPGSGILGLLLCGLGHDVGFPVPVGGAERLIDALVARLRARGGDVRCDREVEHVVIERGRAVGVELVGGDGLRARNAVIATVTAPVLDRIAGEAWHRGDAPAGRFEPSLGTFKVDWALSRPIPWEDATVAPAGTVHIAPTSDELSVQAHQLARGVVPDAPFVIVGQMTTSDPTRSPEGTESAWAYTHVPSQFRRDAAHAIRGDWGPQDLDVMTRRVESRIEALAPGFGATIIGRHVAGPRELERANPSLWNGDIAGGTVQLYQQGPFRPPGSLGATSTAVRGLFIGSSSVHPGGGVHGGPGARAARAAIRRAWIARAARPKRR